MFGWFKKRPLYFDHASATPCDPRVVLAMKPFFLDQFYNPSGLYARALSVEEALHAARETIAYGTGVQPRQVIFAGGGTEANNLAIMGALRRWQRQFPGKVPHVITSAIEHPSVREILRDLKTRREIFLDEIPVDHTSLVPVEAIRAALRPDTALVSIMYVNNEIGTIQPIKEITKAIRHFKKHVLQDPGAPYPLMHTDAIQAVNYLDIHMPRLGADLMVISAAKIYGPKGVAALIMRHDDLVDPIIMGGGQERGLRSGTENIPAIIGFAKACEIARTMSDRESKRLTILRDMMIKEIVAAMPSARINGAVGEARIPNNVNISFPGLSSEQLVIELDARGIMASSRAACSSDDPDESYVLQAMYPGENIEQGSVRFTLGRATTKGEVMRVVEILKTITDKLYATAKRFRK